MHEAVKMTPTNLLTCGLVFEIVVKAPTVESVGVSGCAAAAALVAPLLDVTWPTASAPAAPNSNPNSKIQNFKIYKFAEGIMEIQPRANESGQTHFVLVRA